MIVWLFQGHGYWTVVIFRVRFIVFTSLLWSFYLFLCTASLLAIRLPFFNKLELSWVDEWSEIGDVTAQSFCFYDRHPCWPGSSACCQHRLWRQRTPTGRYGKSAPVLSAMTSWGRRYSTRVAAWLPTNRLNYVMPCVDVHAPLSTGRRRCGRHNSCQQLSQEETLLSVSNK